MTRLDRKSDAQANAEALARRTSTYADEHAASWQVAFDRPTHEPRSLDGYISELRDAYSSECPSRLHVHALSEGGTPEVAGAFAAWLDGEDQGPLRNCLRGMARARDERTQSRARIAYRIVVGGMSAREAAVLDGVPGAWADTVAFDCMQVAWRRYCSTPIGRRVDPLPQRAAVA